MFSLEGIGGGRGLATFSAEFKFEFGEGEVEVSGASVGAGIGMWVLLGLLEEVLDFFGGEGFSLFDCGFAGEGGEDLVFL